MRARSSSGQARHEAGEERVHGVRRQRLEVERARVAPARAPGRPPLGQLRPGEHDHEQRMAARPVHQVLDEVEQRSVGPLHVLEDEHGRHLVGQPLVEEPPGAEEVLALPLSVLLEAEQVSQPRLDEAALVGVGDRRLDGGAQLGPLRGGVLALGDLGARAHHLGERPEGDAFAVGQAAAAVPAHVLGQAVDVLEELPREPRLARPGDRHHRDEMGLALTGRGVKELLDHAQLPVAAHERRLEAGRPLGAADAADHPHRPPQRHRLDLALELAGARVLVDDRRLGRVLGRLAHEHRARLGHRLDPRGGVHQVAGHHPLGGRADRDRRLAGEHPDAGTQIGRADLGSERLDGRREVERCPHRPLGVVLHRHRRSPHRHHRVADELLDGAAVAGDQRAARVEVARQELAHVLGVARLRHRGEPDQVGEEDRHQPPLGHRLQRGRGAGRRRARGRGERQRRTRRRTSSRAGSRCRTRRRPR